MPLLIHCEVRPAKAYPVTKVMCRDASGSEPREIVSGRGPEQGRERRLRTCVITAQGR
jgi:hypothetical protein